MKRLLQFFIYIFLVSSFKLNAATDTVYTVGNTGFTPDPLNVNVGDTVVFMNSGGFHNVNFANHPSLGTSGNPVGAGYIGTFIFNTTGQYDYQCDPHVPMGMFGTIEVNSNPTIENFWIKPPDCANEPITSPTGNISVKIDNPSNVACSLQLYFQIPAFTGNYIAGPSQQIGGAFVDSAGFNNIFPNNYIIYLVDEADPTIIYDSIVPPSIFAPDSLVIQLVSLIDPTSILNSDGSIDISVSGGTPGYTYFWEETINNFTSSTEDINNLPVGLYQLTVTDSNNCTISQSWTLEATPCFAGNVEVTNVSCFGDQDGEIHISGAYGTGPLTFAIDTVAYTDPNFPTQLYQNSLHTNTTGSGSWTFSNSSGPSNYSVPRRVGGEVYYYYFTSADPECDIEDNIGEIEVDRFGEIYSVDIDTTNTDPGASNGSIQVTNISGGYPLIDTINPPLYVGYLYEWYDSDTNLITTTTTNIFSGLDSGLYHLVITDSSDFRCESPMYQVRVNIAPPCSPEIDTIIHNVCPQTFQGEVHIGSLYGYNSFFLSDSLDNIINTGVIYDTIYSIVFDSLSSGEYTITLLDTNLAGICDSFSLGPILIQEPVVNSPIILSANPNGSNNLCSGDSTQLLVNVTVPTSNVNYNYYISGGPIPGTSINDTTNEYYFPGSYQLVLFYNDSSCINDPNYIPLSFDIIEYKLEFSSINSVADSSCASLPTGQINVVLDTVTNLPVTYNLYNSNNTLLQSDISNSLSNDYDQIIYGTYNLTIEDNNGCVVESNTSVTVEEINNLQVHVVYEKETCYEYDGSVQLIVDTNHYFFSADSLYYDFCLLDSLGNPIVTITPTDTFGYYINPITNDTLLSNIVDNGYTYTFEGLTAGLYHVLVKTDACHDTIPLTIEKVIQPTITGLNLHHETCCGYDGSIDALVDIGDAMNIQYTITFDTTVIAIDTINGTYPYMNGLNAWPSQSFIDTFVNVQDSSHFVNLTRGYYLIHLYDSIIGCEDIYSSKIDLGIDSSLASQLDMQLSFTNMLCYDSINATVKVLYPNVCYDYQLWLYNDTLNPNLISTDFSSSIDSFVYFNELYKGIYGVQAISHSKYKGCVVRSDTIEILEPEIISYDSPLSSAVYCTNPGTCNGKVWLPSSPVGGVLDTSSIVNNAVYKYYINKINTSANYFNGPILTDSMFVALCPGDYEVQVTDGNNCIVRDTVTVLDSSLYIDSFHVTTISCFDSTNATAQVFAHGGREPLYTYVWQDSSSVVIDSSYNSLVSNLSTGTYSVTVYDSTGCMALDFTEILSAPEKLVLAAKREDYSTAENCLGESYDGSIGFEIRGGTQPYIFNWSFYNDPSIFGTDTANSVYCDTCTSYQWDDLQIDSVYILEGLTANSYLISITDINGCIDTLWLPIDSFRVTARNQNNPLVFENIVHTDSICFNSQNGDVTIMIDTIASWPLSYSIDDGDTYSSDSVFNNLAVGSYDIKVKDTYGCTIDSSFVINEYDSLFIHLDSIQNISCYGDTNGMISITSHGGSQPHTYLWTGPNGFTSTATSITDLYIGTYSVIVSDINLCLIADSFEISEPTPLQLNVINTSVQDVSCNGKDDGRAEVEVLSNSGTSPYDFLWSNGVANALNSSLSAGISTCTVTDFNGCQEVISVTIDEPNELVLNVLNVEDNLCAGEQIGEIFVSGSGGTEPYQYIINNVSQNDPLFENLVSGSYTLSFVDANDCSSAEIIQDIKEPGQINLPISVFRTTCNSSDDGLINVVFNNGIAPYDYNLYRNGTLISSGNVFNVEDTLVLTHLSPASYYISVEDYNGCTTSSNEVEVIEPELIVADFSLSSDLITKGSVLDITNLSTPSSGDWQANVFEWNILDGNGSFESGYDFTSENPQISYSKQGIYTITLIANNIELDASCESIFSKVVEVQGYDVINLFSPNDDQINDLFHFQDQLLDELYVEIYNRWGKRVYHWQGPQGFWDGKGYNSELLPEGVYFFVMEAVGKDGSEYTEKGSVTLVR